jgi:hypothetical protein
MIPAWQNRLEKRSTKMNTSRRLLSLAFILVPALLSPIVRTTGADQRVTIPIITAPAAFVGPNINASRLTGNHHENSIAINPANPAQVVVVSNTENSPGMMRAYSTDSGATWTSGIIANGDALGNGCGDPSLAWDNFGNLFLTYLDCTITDVQLGLSTDGGQTFSFVTTVARPTPLAPFGPTKPGNPYGTRSGAGVDQPTVAVGAGSVWVTYNTLGAINARGASVTGLGVVGAFNAAQVPPGSSGGNFGDIAIGPSGQVMVTYQNNTGGAGPATIFMNVDADGLGPGGFGAAVSVTTTNVGGVRIIPAQSNNFGIDAEVGLAYDRSGGVLNGRVHVVYTDAPSTSSNDTNIFTRFSTDDGATWSAAIRINDDAGTNSQFLPRVALDQTTGNIAVSWYDSRNDTGMGSPGDTNGIANDDAQLFATFSTDGGSTFAANLKISTGTSNSAASEPPGPCCRPLGYGDYAGLAFHNGSFYPGWADNSNSTGDNPDGSLSKFDVYTARISVSCTSIICPPNKVQSNDPGQCGAVITYTNATSNGSCGTISCSPVSGSFFPVGTTTVTCTSSAGPNCTFTVTVNDTQPPTIICPANITQSTDPGVCSAVVNYPSPTVSDNCPGVSTPTCTPVSGSTFPKGTTTVSCNVSDASGNTASCSFTITVNDTQPPTITCPVNIFVAAAASCPIATSTVVTYPPPVATDNCPGVTTACSPTSGTIFPVGTTTVTCTATDTSGNTAQCSFTVTVFSGCMVDETNPGNVVLFNAQTGEYRFCCSGVLLATGKGVLTIRACIGTIDELKGERKVHIEFDFSANNGRGKGIAALFLNGSSNPKCKIIDQSMAGNVCSCP